MPDFIRSNFTQRLLSSVFIILYVVILLTAKPMVKALLLGTLCVSGLCELWSMTQKWNAVFWGYGCFWTTSFLLAYFNPLLLKAFLITCLHDTGGYLLGPLLGGPKIAPSISPSKTWSGLLGGTFLGFLIYPQWSSILANFIGLGGDLVESKIKRIYRTKDSGTLIPGHGGILDRFDSFVAINLFFFIQSLGIL